MSDILTALFLGMMALVATYLVRHYVFTLTVLKSGQARKKNSVSAGLTYTPTVSILIPAHNEEHVIGRILQRMTELTYPKDKLQIVAIDDASTDGTGEIAEQYSKKHDYVKVLHRLKNVGGRGKAVAMNEAMKLVEGEIVLCFDADYYPRSDIVAELTKEFADPKVGAVQGRVTVLNEPQNLVTRLVALERIGGFRVDQQARESLGLVPQYGGTVCGVRRSLLERLGGWDESILAEDTDLTFRVYLAGFKVRYINEAESYEEAVESWRAYWRQRSRWAKGHMQCFFRHSLKVLMSKNLKRREKIDGLLLLGVYFMPVLTLLSWVIGVSLFFSSSVSWFGSLWALSPVSAYSFMGNFAPFFEVGVGAYLDGRRRAHWLLSLLVFTFFLNILICSKALADLVASALLGKKSNDCWMKTMHSGNGNSYIMN